MDMDLKNRKVVVTGAGDGIGRSLALAFGEAGARVAGCARNSDKLHAVEKEIDGAGHLFATADCSKSDDIQQFHDKVISALGESTSLSTMLGRFRSWRVFSISAMKTGRKCSMLTSCQQCGRVGCLSQP